MEELRHAQRMDVIGQLSSSVAHDFNNLLTLIAGYAELLALEAGSDVRTAQLARDIQSDHHAGVDADREAAHDGAHEAARAGRLLARSPRCGSSPRCSTGSSGADVTLVLSLDARDAGRSGPIPTSSSR